MCTNTFMVTQRKTCFIHGLVVPTCSEDLRTKLHILLASQRQPWQTTRSSKQEPQPRLRVLGAGVIWELNREYKESIPGPSLYPLKGVYMVPIWVSSESFTHGSSLSTGTSFGTHLVQGSSRQNALNSRA